MKRQSFRALAALFALASFGTALAVPVLDPTATVTPASAPNAFGSPSFTGWVANSIQAQYLGVSSYGTPGTPSYYQAAPATMSISDNVVTGFNSWQGQANPGAVFGQSYAAELGNRLHFGIDLVASEGGWVSIDKLSFTATSTDPGNTLSFSYSTGSYGYSMDYRGLMYGLDGKKGTADDYWITSGPAWQNVNEIIGRGSGNAWPAYTTDPGLTLQDKIGSVNTTFGLPTTPFDFTGTYSYNGNVVGSATVEFNAIAAVPDSNSPTAALLGLGMIGLAGLSRRRGMLTG